MANPDIVNYIKQARAAGDPDEKIKSDLVSAGWEARDVDDAFREASAEKPAEAKPAEETKPAEEKKEPAEGELGKKSMLKAVLRVILFLACLILGVIGFIAIFINEWIGRAIMIVAIAGFGYGVYDNLHDTSKLKYLNIAVKVIIALIFLFMLVRSFW